MEWSPKHTGFVCRSARITQWNSATNGKYYFVHKTPCKWSSWVLFIFSLLAFWIFGFLCFFQHSCIRNRTVFVRVYVRSVNHHRINISRMKPVKKTPAKSRAKWASFRIWHWIEKPVSWQASLLRANWHIHTCERTFSALMKRNKMELLMLKNA